jgi:tRNA G10  N-methylase Trm11
MQSFAILGAHPAISIAEIGEITGQYPGTVTEAFAIYNDIWTDAPHTMRTSGSVQKLGRIKKTLPKATSEFDLRTALLETLSSLPEGKIHFGLSVYGETKDADRIGRLIPSLGINLKRDLAAQGRSARVVATKGNALPAASIMANKLIQKGAEIILLTTENELLIGITEAVQNIDTWVLHDRGRPRTNAKQGMLPPKLARIMLNLAGAPVGGATVLDPFCGSGTVLMEAGILGAHHLTGSDLNEMAINDTKENLTWAEEALHYRAQTTLVTSSAKDAATKFPPASVDLLVTEPYLGRPRRGNEPLEEVEETIEYLTRLYEESFSSLKSLLKPGARMVIASPVHLFEEQAFPVPTERIMVKLGFTPLPFKESLWYHHEGQFVGRELLRFAL